MQRPSRLPVPGDRSRTKVLTSRRRRTRRKGGGKSNRRAPEKDDQFPPLHSISSFGEAIFPSGHPHLALPEVRASFFVRPHQRWHVSAMGPFPNRRSLRIASLEPRAAGRRVRGRDRRVLRRSGPAASVPAPASLIGPPPSDASRHIHSQRTTFETIAERSCVGAS